MDAQLKERLHIRPIAKDEPVPYDLLLDADPAKEIVDKYLPASAIYVALLDEAIVGVYVLYPVDERSIEVKNIAVAERYQRMGIGVLMLSDAQQRSKVMGYSSLIICTGNISFVPLYIYQKQGFDITGIKRNYIVDNYPEPLYEHGIRVRHLIVM